MVALDTDGFDDFAVPLDLLLTRPVFGLAERITPNMSWRRFAINLARQPGVVASRAGTLGKELGAIAAGRSEIAPANRRTAASSSGDAVDTSASSTKCPGTTSVAPRAASNGRNA